MTLNGDTATCDLLLLSQLCQTSQHRHKSTWLTSLRVSCNYNSPHQLTVRQTLVWSSFGWFALDPGVHFWLDHHKTNKVLMSPGILALITLKDNCLYLLMLAALLWDVQAKRRKSLYRTTNSAGPRSDTVHSKQQQNSSPCQQHQEFLGRQSPIKVLPWPSVA